MSGFRGAVITFAAVAISLVGALDLKAAQEQESDVFDLICLGSGGGGSLSGLVCDGVGAQSLCNQVAALCGQGITARVAEVVNALPCTVVCQWTSN
jgi:hypothetical protein